VLVHAAENNCTSWYNCAGGCDFGKWSDTTIASIGRWKAFNDNCEKSMDIMQKHPGVKSLDRGIVHASLQYLCCYGSGEYNRYISVIDNFNWHSVNVTYGRAVCNSDAGDQEHNSLIVLMDDKSQKAMMDLIKGFEAALEAAGIHVNRTRDKQEPFHTTLGVVGKGYPVDSVLAEINGAIPNFSPTPINIKNFLLSPVPLWQFHSSDSRRAGSGTVGEIAPHDDMNDDVEYFARLNHALAKRAAPRGRFSPTSLA